MITIKSGGKAIKECSRIFSAQTLKSKKGSRQAKYMKKIQM